MTTPKKTTGKPTLDSTASPAATNKPKVKCNHPTEYRVRHGDGSASLRLFPEARDCCTAINAILASAPSGSMLTTEDGVFVVVEPPTVLSYWAFDPAANGGLPYWEPL